MKRSRPFSAPFSGVAAIHDVDRINPGPGEFVSTAGLETSNKPMPGYFELTDGEGGPAGGGQNAWVSQ
jgi:hypothetical protein